MMDRMRRGRLAGALAICLSVLAPSGARGQSMDPKTVLAAQALYDEATAEMDAGAYASACRKLEEVTRMVPEGLGAKLSLARCYEGQGRLATAFAQYTRVAELTASAGQEERARSARERAAALRSRVATLVIEVPPEVRSIPGLVITRDGVRLGDMQWGTAQPVDAGAHEVTATAPGRKPRKLSVSVPTDGVKVEVRVEPLEVEAAARSRGPAPVGKEAPEAPQRPWQRPLGLGAMGLGGAGMVVGAVLGGLALAKKGESNQDNHCDAKDRCDDAGLALREEAVRLGNGSTAAIMVGGAALVAGVTLFATAPSGAAKGERAGAGAGRLRARVELLPGGARVMGSW